MRLSAATIALLMMLLASSPSSAWVVPGTEITQCYDNTGIIPCPVEGGPFFGQNGNYPGLAHTFIENSGAVTDQATGLVWQKTPDGVTRDWDAAVAYCAELELANQSDWRLPTALELATIIDFARSKPAFPEVLAGQNGHYWTSTPYVGYVGPAWYVNFAFGTSEFNAGTDTRQVRCVRGTTIPPPSPTAQGNLVADASSGLVWAKSASAAGKTWQEALAACRTQVIDRYNDWRLPDILELRTVIDYTRVSPAIDATVFVGVDSVFWTSSTFASYADIAWQVNFQAGTAAGESKTTTAGVLCLRNSTSRLPAGNIPPIMGLLLQ